VSSRGAYVLAMQELDDIDRANGVLPPLSEDCAKGLHPLVVEITCLGDDVRTWLCTSCVRTLLSTQVTGAQAVR